jgi:predicted transcriptional regulator
MLKKITFCADSDLIEKARRLARLNHSSLKKEFQIWLEQYVNSSHSELDSIVSKMDYVRIGRHFSREDMNER